MNDARDTNSQAIAAKLGDGIVSEGIRKALEIASKTK